jgi:hypothetical protein
MSDPEDELEIEWIPEEDDFVPSYEPENLEEFDAKIQEFNHSDLPAFMVDKMCQKKFGHTNWARMANIEIKDLIMNPSIVDYNEGIVYFKNRRLV